MLVLRCPVGGSMPEATPSSLEMCPRSHWLPFTFQAALSVVIFGELARDGLAVGFIPIWSRDRQSAYLVPTPDSDESDARARILLNSAASMSSPDSDSLHRPNPSDQCSLEARDSTVLQFSTDCWRNGDDGLGKRVVTDFRTFKGRCLNGENRGRTEDAFALFQTADDLGHSHCDAATPPQLCPPTTQPPF